MKRFITFSVIVMALIFTVVGVVREQSKDATLDVSNGLSVIAGKYEMAKYALKGQKIIFSADDFAKNLNINEVSSITLTTIPAVTEGCLCVGDVVVNAGQSISGSNLDLLNFRAADDATRETVFKFKVNGGEYEITCKLYFLSRENSAPTIVNNDLRYLSVSTHQGVTVFGKVGAYDPDGDEIRYEVVTYAKGGTLDFDSSTGEYLYTPVGMYFGEDYFEYVAVDKYGNFSPSQKVSLTVEKLQTDTVFCDMDGHRAHHAALTMAEMNVMSGVSLGDNTYFMPDKSVSRIDFLVMLMHALGYNDVEAVFDTGFDDDAEIPASLKGYVREARKLGIISGSVNEEGEFVFLPNSDITRAEAALIVSRVVGISVPTVKPTFTDKNDIPAWAHDAIYTLNDLGFLDSNCGEISPTANITRAQVAEMLYALTTHLK